MTSAHTASTQSLNEITDKLFGLLNDPHSGLATWNEALVNVGNAFQIAAQADDAYAESQTEYGLVMSDLCDSVHHLKGLLDENKVGLQSWQGAKKRAVMDVSQQLRNARLEGATPR